MEWHYNEGKNNRDLLIFNTSTTHFQSTSIAHMTLEVLDLDFVKQTCA